MAEPGRSALFSPNPSITVIVPVYNGENFLAEALQSIAQQQYQPLEVLVVDDGSTDRSAEVAAGFPGVRVLHKAHSGLAATLNQGLRHATGELLAFLDADDRWLPGKLARQVAELQQRPELDVVFGHARQFSVRPTAHGNEVIFFPPQPAVAKAAMLVRRAAFQRVGEFAEQADRHDFLDWYARARAAGLQSVVIADVVIERRIHEHNTGRTNTDSQRQGYLRTLRAAVHRRRSEATPDDQSSPEQAS